MFVPSPAVRPFAGGVPRRAATAAAHSDASERASGKQRPRAAPARDLSTCLTKMTRNRNSFATTTDMEVLTVGGKTSSQDQELLQKRLASELDALRGILKKAELTSRGGACKGGAPTPTAGKNDRFLAPKQRPKPIEDGGRNAPSAKRMKLSTPMEQKQMQAPWMSPEERKQFGEADAHGEIDKFAEESKDEKLAEESKGEVIREKDEEYADISGGLPPSEPASGTTAQSGEEMKVQDVQRAAPTKNVYCMRGLIYKANVRRQLLEMERAALPEQSIHRRDLQHLCIAEYGRPSVMRQIGLVLKAGA